METGGVDEALPKVENGPRLSAMVAGAIAGTAILCVGGTLLLIALNASTAGVTGFAASGSRLVDGIFTVCLIAYPLVGALIVARQPQNPIGWIVSGGLLLVVANLAHEFGYFALLTEPSLRFLGEISIWLASWLAPVSFFFMASLLLLLFPGGRFLAPPWRVVAWLALVASLAVAFGFAVSAELLTVEVAANPFAIEALDPVLEPVILLGFLGFLIAILAGVACLILRFRHSQGVEREQLKWVVSAAAFLAVSWIAGALFEQVLFPEYEASAVSDILLNVAVVLIPVSIGIAILRYRLYDIDFIINRALVYGSLTAILAGVYAAAIQLFKVIFESLTGTVSDASVILTTLLLAAVFTPVKNRLQRTVDRYFGSANASGGEINEYAGRVASFILLMDARKNAREFLKSSVVAYKLEGGSIYLHGPTDPVCVATEGAGARAGALRVALAEDGHEVGFALLGRRLDGHDLSAAEVQALEATGRLVGQAIGLVEGLRVPRGRPTSGGEQDGGRGQGIPLTQLEAEDKFRGQPTITTWS